MVQPPAVDRDVLVRSYDRSADTYDERFRALQRAKFLVAARLLRGARLPPGELCLDAGGGTGLLGEWLEQAEGEPDAEVRAELREMRMLVLDLSLGMLRVARGRSALCVGADLAWPPLRNKSCALVVAFTSVLETVPRGLKQLALLVAPRGRLVVSFLAAEAPSSMQVASLTGLSLLAGPVAAGQDQIFLLQRGLR